MQTSGNLISIDNLQLQHIFCLTEHFYQSLEYLDALYPSQFTQKLAFMKTKGTFNMDREMLDVKQAQN